MSAALDIASPAAPAGRELTPIAGGQPKSALIPFEQRGVELRTMEQVFLFARAYIDSGMAPRGMDTPQKVFIAVQMGAEVGLSPMAALRTIAVINNRPTIYGDAVPGLCQATGQLEDYKDEAIGADDSYGFRVTVKRRGRSEPVVRKFTVADAKRAGLWGKAGPWTQYPDRMLLMRARTFALHDSFPDALQGLPTFEETRDLPEKNVTDSSLDELDRKEAAP